MTSEKKNPKNVSFPYVCQNPKNLRNYWDFVKYQENQYYWGTEKILGKSEIIGIFTNIGEIRNYWGIEKYWGNQK